MVVRFHPGLFIKIVLISSCLILGCVPSKVQVQKAPQFDPTGISSVAVLPFYAYQTPQWGHIQAGAKGIKDPEEIRTQFRLPGADHVEVGPTRQNRYSVSPTAAQRITSKVVSLLGLRSSLRVHGPSDSTNSTSIPIDEFQASMKSLAHEAGERWDVDGVLMGLVRTYREREGTKLGAKPAAVGFEIFLVRPSDGTVLWKGEFFEEQKPLNEDVVGFFEKGVGFVTAEELAEFGVKKVMDAFPIGYGDRKPSPRS